MLIRKRQGCKNPPYWKEGERGDRERERVIEIGEGERKGERKEEEGKEGKEGREEGREGRGRKGERSH